MSNSLQEAYLRRIVEEASTIKERLEGAFQPVESDDCARLADERLAKWREKISGDNATAILKRLAWLKTTPEDVKRVLGCVRFTGALPSWTAHLARALDSMSTEAVSNDFTYPFGALIAPFAEQARELIAPACGPLFSAKAIDELVGDLSKELSQIAAPAYYLKFSVFRSTHGGVPEGAPSTQMFNRFQRQMLGGGMRDFFLEYPVLARLLSTTVEDGVRNALEMASALSNDMAEISNVFAAGASLGIVVGLRPSLSDRHNGGRTVALLEFENGARIVYKPRDVGIEKAWFDFLAELNAAGGEFRLLKVLAKNGHGWVEAARAAPCANAIEIERYYLRAGMLLCVLYATEASDCFFENIIACGPFPLLIDMETLMHHVLRKEADLSPAEEIADDIIFNSVFRAGFLPAWEIGPDGRCVDISGLGAEPGQTTSYVRRSWKNVNTDAVTLEQQNIQVDNDGHLPKLNGSTALVAAHADRVIAGFQHMYRIFMANASRMTVTDGPLWQLACSEIRLVFHATRLYGLVLKRLGAPKHMRNGVERSIEMDVISRFYLEARKKDRFRDILDAETVAMDRLDIPKFTVRADERSLRLPTGLTLYDIFEEPAIERVRRRIRAFGEDDLRLQSEFIRCSLGMFSVDVPHQPALKDARQGFDETASLKSSDFVAEARAIAQELSSRAILSADGGATWIAPQLLPGTNRHELRPLRKDLYSGLAGVALFYAALHRTTGSGGDMALAALAPLRKYLLEAEPERMVRDGYTLGAATGAGSFVSSLTWCAELLDEPVLFSEAIAFCEKITPGWIRDDDAFDIMAGSAGAIMGLLCLYKRTRDPGVLVKSAACGERLIQTGERADLGLAWPTMRDRKRLTGFSHGAAGIGAALFQLGVCTGETRFIEAADLAIEFENSLFDAGNANWPDLRVADGIGPNYMHTWCHGAPGIGLGRAICASGRSTYRNDLETALRTTRLYGIGGRDGLCCGALGRADLFVVKAVMDEDEAAENCARAWAAKVIQRKRSSGGYRLTGRQGQEFFDPSFFQGLSGIGYQLLRIAHPRLLPSVLAWE